MRLAAATVGACVAISIILAFAVLGGKGPVKAAPSRPGDGGSALPTAPASYIGLYPSGVPASSAGVTTFAADTGVKPDVVLYYSGWFEPFQAAFARTLAREGAVPLVQMNPEKVSVADIASGRYDVYLRAYARAVRAYRRPVIIGFGHEMNGDWYPWGYKNTAPRIFVAAWRHVVSLFRSTGARNVTWLWTVNVIDDPQYGKVPNPASWWPGSAYVTWVGIDGYYFHPSAVFSSLFGPTIAAVRALTRAPILIAETAALPTAGQPAKITDLFAGIRTYGLLGFVWFDSTSSVGQPFVISTPRAITTFRKNAAGYAPGTPGEGHGLGKPSLARGVILCLAAECCECRPVFFQAVVVLSGRIIGIDDSDNARYGLGPGENSLQLGGRLRHVQYAGLGNQYGLSSKEAQVHDCGSEHHVEGEIRIPQVAVDAHPVHVSSAGPAGCDRA